MVSPAGSMVGMPGMNVLTVSSAPQRLLFFLFLSPPPSDFSWLSLRLRLEEDSSGMGAPWMATG